MTFTIKKAFLLFTGIVLISLAQTFASGTEFTDTSAFEKHPYLIYTGKNTEMMVLWQMVTTVTCRVEWGLDTNYETGNQTSVEFGNSHQHKLTITGLTPGTKYFYKVTANNGESKTGDFMTAPAADATKVTFYAYGDTRTYPEYHAPVAKKISEEIALNPASQTMVLFGGDFVQYGNEESSWSNEFFNPQYPDIQNLLARVPLLGAMGNHEGHGILYAKYFPYPQFVSGRYYFSFDYANVHVAVLDQYTLYSPGSAQYSWLESDLATTTKPWKIILLHEPGWTAYPVSGGHSNNLPVQNVIQPLCLKYDVQMVISAHNHYYSRADVNNVMHITTAGGGAPQYTPAPQENVVIFDKSYHFCQFGIDDTKLRLTAKRSNGSVIETFDYVKSNEPGIYVSPRTILTNPGSTHQLSSVVFPKTFSNEQVNWTSDNEAVATVSSSGLVTVKSDGKATITASILGGTKISTASISVSAYTGNLSIDNCDAITGWGGSSSNVRSLNTADQMEGTACVQSVGSVSEEFKKVFSLPFNSGSTPSNGVLKFWYYISDVSLTGTVRVEAGSGGKADTDELQWSLSGLKNGWNEVSLRTSTASRTGTTNLAAINWFRIYATKSGSITTRIDDIRMGPDELFSGINHVNTKNGMSFKLIPNPYKSGNLTLNLSGFENEKSIRIKIYNICGEPVLIKEIPYSSSQKEMELPHNLPESIYLVSVETDKIQLTEKFIKS